MFSYFLELKAEKCAGLQVAPHVSKVVTDHWSATDGAQ